MAGMLYDITPPITPALAVWPGDTPMSREVLLDMQQGANLTLSTLHTTVHLGAHADGPNHYGADAPAIDRRSLDFYLGECQVMHVPGQPSRRIGMADLTGPVRAERLLIATGTYSDPNQFDERFAALEPGLIDTLASRGVKLIGIDTPSVDLFDSKDLPAHQRFLAHDLAILEGLVLSEVPDGIYELIALPLKLVGFDASPVRAVLREI
ncbi:MAG: cyclase family protein [Phycisphaerae bacterium]